MSRGPRIVRKPRAAFLVTNSLRALLIVVAVIDQVQGHLTWKYAMGSEQGSHGEAGHSWFIGLINVGIINTIGIQSHCDMMTFGGPRKHSHHGIVTILRR